MKLKAYRETRAVKSSLFVMSAINFFYCLGDFGIYFI